MPPRASGNLPRVPRVTFVLSLHGGLVGGGLENQAEATKAALGERGPSSD